LVAVEVFIAVKTYLPLHDFTGHRQLLMMKHYSLSSQ